MHFDFDIYMHNVSMMVHKCCYSSRNGYFHPTSSLRISVGKTRSKNLVEHPPKQQKTLGLYVSKIVDPD